jgi:rare lipoprotein A
MMPSTTDDRTPSGLVFKFSVLVGALFSVSACVPGMMPPVTQASAPPLVPTAQVQIDFEAISIEPSTDEPISYSEQDVTLAREVGLGSWYGPRFQGRRTSSGERFNQHDLTAAHKTLPFGSRVRVTNVENGRSVELRITDRGPRSRNRIIDISSAAANAIGMKRQGVGVVQVDLLPDVGDGIMAQQGPARTGPRPIN